METKEKSVHDSQDDFLPPRILSEEEIRLYLKGDRREIDRIILLSLNRLAANLIPHTRREEERILEQERVIKSLGGEAAMAKRAKYVDSLIVQAEAKTRMMEKVAQSSALWILLPFLGFVASALWDAVVKAIKIKIGG